MTRLVGLKDGGVLDMVAKYFTFFYMYGSERAEQSYMDVARALHLTPTERFPQMGVFIIIHSWLM
jgi:hypothetical protein